MAKACKSKYKLPCSKKFKGKTYRLVVENSDYRKHIKAVDELEAEGEDVRGTSFERRGRYVYGIYVRGKE
jgi:hypothetical protein